MFPSLGSYYPAFSLFHCSLGPLPSSQTAIGAGMTPIVLQGGQTHRCLRTQDQQLYPPFILHPGQTDTQSQSLHADSSLPPGAPESRSSQSSHTWVHTHSGTAQTFSFPHRQAKLGGASETLLPAHPPRPSLILLATKGHAHFSTLPVIFHFMDEGEGRKES